MSLYALYCTLLYAQHVSGTSMPIIRSSRLYVCYCRLWCFISAIKHSVTFSWFFFSTHIQRCTDKHTSNGARYTNKYYFWQFFYHFWHLHILYLYDNSVYRCEKSQNTQECRLPRWFFSTVENDLLTSDLCVSSCKFIAILISGFRKIVEPVSEQQPSASVA